VNDCMKNPRFKYGGHTIEWQQVGKGKAPNAGSEGVLLIDGKPHRKEFHERDEVWCYAVVAGVP
jgi:hypothetical protein